MEVRNGKHFTVRALLAGGLVGAGIALLLAPQSGRRTRRQIRHAGKKLLNRYQAAGMDLRHSIDNIVDDIADVVQDGMEHSRGWSMRAQTGMKKAMDSGRETVKEGLERIRRIS